MPCCTPGVPLPPASSCQLGGQVTPAANHCVRAVPAVRQGMVHLQVEASVTQPERLTRCGNSAAQRERLYEKEGAQCRARAVKTFAKLGTAWLGAFIFSLPPFPGLLARSEVTNSFNITFQVDLRQDPLTGRHLPPKQVLPSTGKRGLPEGEPAAAAGCRRAACPERWLLGLGRHDVRTSLLLSWALGSSLMSLLRRDAPVGGPPASLCRAASARAGGALRPGRAQGWHPASDRQQHIGWASLYFVQHCMAYVRLTT
jgi:hypothetical protein